MHRLLIAALWLILWVVIIEMSAHLIYDYLPQSLQRYVNYGLSVESKIRQTVGKTDEETDFVKTLGWLDPSREQWYKNKKTKATQPDHTLLAVYGMSFAANVTKKVVAHYPKFESRFVGGPDSPPNHSYAMWLLDQDLHQADVVIWGILSSNVKAMESMTSLNRNFEAPLPYTYPKFKADKGNLQVNYPPILTLAEFRSALYNKEKWNEYVTYLEQEDKFYHSFLFKENILDQLILGRFFRRSLALRANQQQSDIYHAKTGFDPNNNAIQALNLMVTEFAQQVRAKKQLPIIMLFSIQGYDNHLYNALAQTLTKNNIPFLNSFTVADPANSKNFIADGHFTPTNDKKMAEKLVNLIKNNL